jgi:Fe-S-cluster containining protein
MITPTWYRDGLRFGCTRCGHCCTGAPGYVWVTDAEIEAIASLRSELVAETRALFTSAVGKRRSLREKTNGDCVFYDHRAGCTVYSARPTQCRTWPFWESNVVTEEAWQHTCEICPGCGSGDFVSTDEITKRIQAIRL